MEANRFRLLYAWHLISTIGQGGHADGAVEAGMINVKGATHKGLTVAEKNGKIFWANDSMSLKSAVTDTEAAVIQRGLEAEFKGQTVERVREIGAALK